MTRRYLPNVMLVALIVSCFIQIGAQLFAVSIIARTVQSAPPRSFAILEGTYRYDSSAFWQTVPPITGVLFLAALVANWKTDRRKLLGGAFTLFLIGGASPASTLSRCSQRSQAPDIATSSTLSCKPERQRGTRAIGRFGASG